MFGQVLGGIGLFLVGMVLTTDGLRSAAGEALRRMLLRFTGGPLKALLTGATITAVVQSSSATTVATIGFVGAGLLTFQQALGVIFGANLGTTATGWLVALVGLKFSVSTLALPLVGLGALIRLIVRGRAASLGMALAGFGIIFVGIDTLQAGMEDLSAKFPLPSASVEGLAGRSLLVFIGFLLTAIMQSSSAAVTTTLAALHTGNLDLQEAAAVVIGVNIGTTVTAALAAIGASTSAKRAAVAHVLFNFVTGLVAFALLPLFVTLVARVGTKIGPGDATILLATFHTAFNLLGVLLIFPFTARFARLVTRAVPEKDPVLTQHLDTNVVAMGAIAIEAVRQTAFDIAGEVFHALAEALRERRVTERARQRLEAASAALDKTGDYLNQLRALEHTGKDEQQRHASTLHVLDYLERLIHVALRLGPNLEVDSPQLHTARDKLSEMLTELMLWTSDSHRPAPLATMRESAGQLADLRKHHREQVLERTARGELTPQTASAQIEAVRRLDEAGYYLWRIADHLRGERRQLGV